MKCLRCKTIMYKGVKKCPTCGFSIEDINRDLQKQVDRVTISDSAKINALYRKMFGYTDKKIIKKLLIFVLLIILIIWLFFHFFIYIDIPNKCFITIKPALTELTNTTMKKGIRYLKKGYWSQYIDFCKNVKTINPNVSCGGFGGGCYYSYNPGVIDISTPYGNAQQAAKVIIHETCHAIQDNENRPIEEGECHAKDSIIPWR